MMTRSAIALAFAGMILATVVGCGGTPNGAGSPTELGKQIIANCAQATEPDVSDFESLMPSLSLLEHVPYDSLEPNVVRMEPDPAADAQRIREAWQVVLDLLITEDALVGVTMGGEPQLMPEREGRPREASLSFSFGDGAGTFHVAAAQVGGRWYVAGARIGELSTEAGF